MLAKTLQAVEIKDADEGLVDVVFSRLNVVDKDGDITVEGAFEDGSPVRVSAYGHASWGPSRGASFVPMPPVGRGTIKVTGDEAVAETRFFLKTQAGRDTFELVKEMGDLQEWSYGYDVVKASKPDAEQRKAGAKQILERLKVHEVSPVLLGAGVGTRTLAVKSEEKPELTFVEEASAVRDAVKALLDRGRSLAEVARGELTVAKREELKALVEALDLIDADRLVLRELLDATDPDKSHQDAVRELARFARVGISL